MSLEVTKRRVQKLIELATGIESMSVLKIDGEGYVALRDVGMKVSDYLRLHNEEKEIIDSDIDLEIIDEVFTVKTVCGCDIVTFNTNSVIGHDKQGIINVIFNLENLRDLLKSDSKAPEKIEEKPTQELIPASGGNPFDLGGDMIENFLMGEMINAFSHNPMISMQILQKKMEGKLNKEVLMKLSTFANTGSGYRNNPMANVAVMQILSTL